MTADINVLLRTLRDESLAGARSTTTRTPVDPVTVTSTWTAPTSAETGAWKFCRSPAVVVVKAVVSHGSVEARMVDGTGVNDMVAVKNPPPPCSQCS